MQHIRADQLAVICFGLLPVMATVLQKGIVVIGLVLGLSALVTALARRDIANLFPRTGLMVLGAAFAWMAICGFMAFDGPHGGLQIFKLLLVAVFAFVVARYVSLLSEAMRRRAIYALGFGCAVAIIIIAGGCVIVLAGIEGIIVTNRSDTLSIFSSGLVTIAIFGPLVAAHLIAENRARMALLFVASAIAVAVVTGSNAATVTMLVVTAAGAAMWVFPRLVARLICLGCVVGTLVLPFAISTVVMTVDDGSRPLLEETRMTDPDGLAGSLGHRFYIWKFATEKAAERPFFGWGFDTSRSIPGGHETIAIGKELMPLHPHNATLQLWLELGVPGLLIGAVVFWLLCRLRTGAASPSDRIDVVPLTLLAIFVSWNLTYGIWQTWWFTTLALALAAQFLWNRQGGGESAP